MRARRALLYVPGDDLHKIQKASSLGVDSICLDIEDGVAANRKVEARQVIRSALGSLDFGRSERLVRINPVGSGLEMEDLDAVLPAHPDGIVIPKVENSSQILQVSKAISQFEQRYDWSRNHLCLIVVVESAFGIINLKEIASSDPRLEGIIFGAEDFAEDVGATRTRESWEVFFHGAQS